MKILTNQKGLTLVEMLVALLLFVLASVLIVTVVTEALERPKQVSILSTLNTYQRDLDILILDSSQTLTDIEIKEKLNLTLDTKLQFDSEGNSQLLSPYKKPYTLSINHDNGQLEVIVKTEGRKASIQYSLVALHKDGTTDYCTNGFGRNNRKPTVLTSTSCTSVVVAPEVPETPEAPIVDSTDPTIRLPLSGVGTSENPYIITTVGELQGMDLCLTCYYRLGNNIDASETLTWNSGEGFDPIGDGVETFFIGNLDGNNKKIKNLYINRPTTRYVGLFSFMFADLPSKGVYNLALENVNITGGTTTGGLVGGGAFVNLDQVSLTGFVKSTGMFLGGLIGSAHGNKITNTYVRANILGESSIGGLTGSSQDVSYEKCYFEGSLRTINYQIGQTRLISGLEFTKGNYTNLYFDGDSSKLYHTTNELHSISDGYDPSEITKLTTAQSKSASSYSNWDYSNIWGISPSINNGYPYLRNNPPN